MKIFRRIIIVILCFTIVILSILTFSETPLIYHPYEINLCNENKDKIFSRIRNEYSSYVSLDDISKEMKETLITSEDKSFYSHSGFDYKRMIKAFINNLRSSSIKEGASTLTQQLARTLYLSNKKTLSRKINEARIAKKIELNYTKDEILELYLNSVYFGHNLYGINAAASYYFDTSPSLLDYSQSAMLTSIIKSPNKYAPDINLDLAIKEKNKVLYSLYKNNIIDVKQYYNELQKSLIFSYKTNKSNNILYYYDALCNQGSNYINERNKKQGITLYSYLDSSIQKSIEELVNKYANENDEIGIVVMKPGSGKVIALIGGKNYDQSSFNRAISSKKQIGSTIKPFIYSLALENGFTPLTALRSEKITYHIDGIGDYSPRNPGDKYANRDINMIEALSLSDNIYSSKTTLILGSSYIANKLESIGIKVENVNPTIALGTVEMSLLQLTSIYNALASSGIYYYPSFFKEIRTSQGKLLTKGSTSGERIFSLDTCLKMSYMLRSPFDSALSSYLTPSLINYPLSVRMSAKTGSTESANYVIGYNSSYTIGVYVGNDENKDVYDKKLSKVLFQKIVNSVIKKDEDVFFTPSSTMKPFVLLNTKSNKTSFTYYR